MMFGRRPAWGVPPVEQAHGGAAAEPPKRRKSRRESPLKVCCMPPSYRVVRRRADFPGRGGTCLWTWPRRDYNVAAERGIYVDLTQVNWISVLGAAVAGMAFGAMYYTVLGKPWMDAAGLTEEQVRKDRGAVPYLISFASLVVMGSVLAGHFAQHAAEEVTALHAVESAAVLWLGFIVTSMATNHAFLGCRPKLTVLDSLHWLGVLVIQGLILSTF